jgi:hypothetical protein
MADLSELAASQSVKIAGADNSGQESNFVHATANNDLQVTDRANTDGAQGSLTVGTSAVEAKVGASALSNRKTLTVFNNSSSIIYWGYTSSVTTSTGTPIRRFQQGSWEGLGPDLSVFLIAGSAGNDTRVTESA